MTIAAMGCQTAIAGTIFDREADDMLALKENHDILSVVWLRRSGGLGRAVSAQSHHR